MFTGVHVEFSAMAFYSALFELAVFLVITFLLRHSISRTRGFSYNRPYRSCLVEGIRQIFQEFSTGY